MVLKDLSEKNLVEFTSNLLDYYKVIDNRLVINQYTSKDPESARDNVGWYRFDEGQHTVNLNIVNMLCAQFGIARGELDLESFYAFVTLCTGHEFRHFLQGTCIYDEKPIDGFDLKDSFNAEVMMYIRQFYDAYYLMNKGYLKYEVDADRFGVIEGVKFLKENFPNMDAKKSMTDAVNFYDNIQKRGVVLPTLPLGCKTYEEIVTAIAEKLRVNKRVPLDESLFVYNTAFYQNHHNFGYDEEKAITEEVVREYNSLKDGSKQDLLIAKRILQSLEKPMGTVEHFPHLCKKYKSQSL